MSSLTGHTVHILSNSDPSTSSFHSSTQAPITQLAPGVTISYVYATPPGAHFSIERSEDLKYHDQNIAAGEPYPAFPGAGGTAAAILEMAANPNNEPGFMHRNDTVDYLFVVEGELELGATSGEVKFVKAGEVVVQRGGNCLSPSVLCTPLMSHLSAWHSMKNPSKENRLKIVAVNVGAEGAEQGKLFFPKQKA
jgi:hypothetical protein